MKIRLSFTTLNAAINAPHTYLAKMMGLKTFSTVDFEAGKAIHRIVQDHVSGTKPHELLVTLPKFSQVERVDFDENMRINYNINDKYELIGFVDGKDPDRKEILEIKSGRAWTVGEFARHAQWKLYALAMPEYKKVWLVNVPKDESLWMPQTIRIFNTDVTEGHRKEALEFINKGLYILENIREEVEKEMQIRKDKGWTGRSRWCYYQGCQWCEQNETIQN